MSENVFKLDLGSAVRTPAEEPITSRRENFAAEATQVYQTEPFSQPAAVQISNMTNNQYGMSDKALYITELVATPAPSDRKRIYVLSGLGVFFLAILGAVVLYGDDIDSPLTPIFVMLGLEPEAPISPVATNAIRRAPETSSQVKTTAVKTNVENPYWSLPNQTLARIDDTTRPWTSEEESILRNGMSHNFNFQRYRTVQEVRQYKLKGSEVLLWDGLNQKKLWIRMQAVIGLADFGVTVDIDTVEKALGKERSSLVSNYFKRHKYNQTEGLRYVLRHAVRLVDASARLEILRALAISPEKLTDLYLVAGTLDPDERIKYFASEELAKRKVNLADQKRYLDVVLGNVEMPVDITALALADKVQGAETNKKVSRGEFVGRVQYFGDLKTEALNEDGLIEVDDKKMEIIEIK